MLAYISFNKLTVYKLIYALISALFLSSEGYLRPRVPPTMLLVFLFLDGPREIRAIVLEAPRGLRGWVQAAD